MLCSFCNVILWKSTLWKTIQIFCMMRGLYPQMPLQMRSVLYINVFPEYDDNFRNIPIFNTLTDEQPLDSLASVKIFICENSSLHKAFIYRHLIFPPHFGHLQKSSQISFFKENRKSFAKKWKSLRETGIDFQLVTYPSNHGFSQMWIII